MSTKPASGTALDTGHALYTNLEAVWAFLEGTGTSTADSKGTNTGTLSGSGLWSTDANGPIIHETNASDTNPIAVTSFNFGATVNISIAFGFKQTTSNDNGMIMGAPAGTDNYIWARGGNDLRIRASGVNTVFTSLTTFTTYADYVITFEYIAGVSNLWNCYKNGTITADSPISQGSNITITTLCGGFSTLSLVGDLSYVYTWRGRVLSGSEASTLASNPYVIFQAGAAPSKRPIPTNVVIPPFHPSYLAKGAEDAYRRFERNESHRRKGAQESEARWLQGFRRDQSIGRNRSIESRCY